LLKLVPIYIIIFFFKKIGWWGAPLPPKSNHGSVHVCEICKIREKYARKKTITQDNIYVIRQLTYIHRVVVISLFIEKRKKYTRRGSTVFLSQNYVPNSNLKQRYFYHAQRIHNGIKKRNKYSRGQAFASWNKFKKISCYKP